MPIIGITGGIASGKTRFTKLLLARMEADAFDADACAHDLLNNDPQVRTQICSQIDPRAYDARGRVDRKRLREAVFQNTEKKKLLEKILHPLIRDRWIKQARTASAKGRKYLVDIPLLFETGAESLFDVIVTIACTTATQLQRLANRNHFNEETSRQIIASQMPLASKMAKARHVVWNEGSSEALEAQTEIFSRLIYDRYGR